MNIRIIRAAGFFTGPTRLEAGGFAIEAKHFIVATGTIPALPSIAGLEQIRLLTPEAISSLEELPAKLVVLGGSPQGVALAQAFMRLGTRVTMILPGDIFPGEDEELFAPVVARLLDEGLVLHRNTDVASVEPQRTGVRLSLQGANVGTVEASHIMLATSRLPCIEGLGLKAAKVSYDENGIKVDSDGRTRNRRIHASGGVTGGPYFGAAAQMQAERVASALFGGRRARAPSVARVWKTDPEVAVIGLREAEARARHRKIRVLRAPFSENFYARVALAPIGHVKIVTNSRGIILGAGIVGPHAAEAIGVFGLALDKHMHVTDLESVVSTVSSVTEACRAAALAVWPRPQKAQWWPRALTFGLPR